MVVFALLSRLVSGSEWACAHKRCRRRPGFAGYPGFARMQPPARSNVLSLLRSLHRTSGSRLVSCSTRPGTAVPLSRPSAPRPRNCCPQSPPAGGSPRSGAKPSGDRAGHSAVGTTPGAETLAEDRMSKGIGAAKVLRVSAKALRLAHRTGRSARRLQRRTGWRLKRVIGQFVAVGRFRAIRVRAGQFRLGTGVQGLLRVSGRR